MTDLSKLATRQNANEGAWMHLKHPTTGEPLFSDKGEPTQVRVRGLECTAVRKLREKAERKNATARGVTIVTDTELGMQVLKALIVGFENALFNGNPLTNEEKDKEIFLNISDDFGEQVLDFASDRANFLD